MACDTQNNSVFCKGNGAGESQWASVCHPRVSARPAGGSVHGRSLGVACFERPLNAGYNGRLMGVHWASNGHSISLLERSFFTLFEGARKVNAFLLYLW